MERKRLYAVDEQGRILVPNIEKNENAYILTFKKETFKYVAQLYLLPELAQAKVGDEGFFIAPRAIGTGGDHLVRFVAQDDVSYCYSQPIMSCYGFQVPGRAALVRIERNYKYDVSISVQDGIYTLKTIFDFTKNDPVYDDIRVEILPMDATATLGDFAAAERNLRLERGEIIPLTEKCKWSAVEYARKFPLVRIRMGWKQCLSLVPHQTPENEPEMHVAVTFARVRDIADALKVQGIEGVELQLVGWNKGGHDGRFPQMMPPEEKMGGIRELKKTIDYVKNLGYRISLHTNTIDAYELAETFTWNDIVVTKEGEYHFHGPLSGGNAYYVCAEKQLKNAKRDLPEVAELGVNGVHFTDVVSIVVPDTCHAKEHPCNTAEGILLTQKNMRYTRELFGGFSSEGCMDFALKDMDYGLYTSIGSKKSPVTDTLVPFFELTYHGVVMYNPTNRTINFPIKTPADQLIFWMRGGRPSMYIHSRFLHGGNNWMGDVELVATDNDSVDYAAEVIARAAKEYAPVADLQLVFMKDYLLHGNGIEEAVYCDGTRMLGNFSDNSVNFRGHTLEPWGYVVLR